MRGVAIVLLVASCDAPAISVATSDAVVETTSCPAIKGVCGGHDEDGDCLPDDCDGCPNIVDKSPSVAPASATATDSCTAVHAPFDTLTKRVLFEPFANIDRWKEVLPELPADVRLHSDGEAAIFGVPAGRVVWVSTTATDVIATAIISRGASKGGVVLRFSETTQTGYVCDVADTIVRASTIRCSSATGCTRESLRDAAGNVAERFLPVSRFTTAIVVRGGVVTTKTGVTLECQVFAAPSTTTEVNATLLSKATEWTVRVEVATPLYAAGAVGLYAPERTSFDSIDVLTSP